MKNGNDGLWPTLDRREHLVRSLQLARQELQYCQWWIFTLRTARPTYFGQGDYSETARLRFYKALDRVWDLQCMLEATL